MSQGDYETRVYMYRLYNFLIVYVCIYVLMNVRINMHVYIK